MSAGQNYLFKSPTLGEIAVVASKIIQAVKADHPEISDTQFAKMIGAKDAGVIERLAAGETMKVPASLITAIGTAFGPIHGPAYIQPYMELMGLKAIPHHCAEAIKALPAITALAAKLAANTQGADGINHQALAAMLPELREVDGIVSALRARASELGLAA